MATSQIRLRIAKPKAFSTSKVPPLWLGSEIRLDQPCYEAKPARRPPVPQPAQTGNKWLLSYLLLVVIVITIVYMVTK
jgi:hypothetical protein